MPMFEAHMADVLSPEVGMRRRAEFSRGSDGGGDRVWGTTDPRLSRSLELGAALLECYSAERQELGIADLAELVGTSRSNTHRYAITLVQLGFLEQGPRRKYRLARHAADAGWAAIRTLRAEVPALRVLEGLRDDVGHTVSMAVLHGTRVIYVHRLPGHRAGQYEIDTGLGVGVSVPVYCTALGKVLLASLSAADREEALERLNFTRFTPKTIVRRSNLEKDLQSISLRKVVVSDKEFRRGSRSVAMLVPRPGGERLIAIDVTVPHAAYTVNRLVKEIGPRLKMAATQISERDSRRPL